MYSTVDSIVVGNYVGTALWRRWRQRPHPEFALGVVYGNFHGRHGNDLPVFGAKDKDSLSATVGTTITATFLSSIVIMIVGPLISPPVMRLLDTPADIYDMSCTYLIIMFLGIIGCGYYNIISGILRGLGDSVMPLIFLLIACGLNIALDLLFVAVFQWGVAGVAIATIISQAISGVLCLLQLMRMKNVLEVTWRSLWPKASVVKKLVLLGLPSGLTQAIFSFAMIIVQSLTNSFGTVVIAANTVVMRVDGFAMMPNFTFGNAMTTYTGQNLGANRMDRWKREPDRA